MPLLVLKSNADWLKSVPLKWHIFHTFSRKNRGKAIKSAENRRKARKNAQNYENKFKIMKNVSFQWNTFYAKTRSWLQGTMGTACVAV